MKSFMLCPPPAEVSDLYLTWDKINIAAHLHKLQDPGAGGVVFFSGEVRNLNNGKRVTHLFYEAHTSMAIRMMVEILEEAKLKFGLTNAFCIHRLGKVEIGESAVLVGTAHVHRKEAYHANEYIIDRVKHEVPIWKNEFYADGTSSWGNNCNCH